MIPYEVLTEESVEPHALRGNTVMLTPTKIEISMG